MGRVAPLGLVILLVGLPSPVQARTYQEGELYTTWTEDSRSSVKIKLCIDSVAGSLALDQAGVINNVALVAHQWNQFGQSDFRFTSIELVPQMNPGCTTAIGGYWEDKTVFIRGFTTPVGHVPWALSHSSCPNDGSSPSTQANAGTIDFFTRDPSREEYCFDWTLTGPAHCQDFRQHLNHEMGHVIGFPDFHPSHPVLPGDPNNWNCTAYDQNSIMHYCGIMQFANWSWDNTELVRQIWTDPDCRPPAGHGYQVRQNYKLKHYRTTTCGQSWTTVADGLVQYTNLPPAVAWRDSSYRYPVLAWVAPDSGHYIHTMKGNLTGTYWSSEVIHATARTDVGVAIAGGGGKYLLAWVERDTNYADRGRKIKFRTSSDGVNWNSVRTLSYYPEGSSTPAQYGVNGQIALAYDPLSSRFVVAWSNWNTNIQDPSGEGFIRMCSATDPDSAEGFRHCTATGKASYGPVSIAFDDGGIFHLVTTDHTGNPDYSIALACGVVLPSGMPLVLSGWDDQSPSWTTHSEISTAFGGTACGSDFVVAYRGEDASTSVGFGRRYQACGDPDLYGQSIISYSGKAGPAISRSTYDGSLHLFTTGQ